MILTREITIKISESNYHYYEDLGYDVTIGEEVIIPIELMSKGSHYKIVCKCDNCGIEKSVIFKNYIKLIKFIRISLSFLITNLVKILSYF